MVMIVQGLLVNDVFFVVLCARLLKLSGNEFNAYENKHQLVLLYALQNGPIKVFDFFVFISSFIDLSYSFSFDIALL